jgi:hypothetical protein
MGADAGDAKYGRPSGPFTTSARENPAEKRAVGRSIADRRRPAVQVDDQDRVAAHARDQRLNGAAIG